ncbi:MAG: V-type ATP synthase subunit D [Clostridia bacterium]|nr:V-type ATP synthase subunit D [Clostridia bacterium]
MAQVFITKNNLTAQKKSLDLAKLGYDLMDKKRNILVREMMTLAEKASTIQKDIDAAYVQAYAALEKATVTLGDCSGYAQCVPVDDSVSLKIRSVMGVELPEISIDSSQPYIYYGMNDTNSQLDEAFYQFEKVKRLTVELAQIESGVMRLADAIKKTQKRTNALSNIMIPKFTSTIKFISDALDEKEREDFTRLKVIKRQKENAV